MTQSQSNVRDSTRLFDPFDQHHSILRINWTMDHLTTAMKQSTLAEDEVDWSFARILESFPTEICSMIVERRLPPMKKPVNSRDHRGRLESFMSVTDGCDTPAEV